MIFFNYKFIVAFIYLCACACTCVHATVHMWKSVLSYQMSSWDWTQVASSGEALTFWAILPAPPCFLTKSLAGTWSSWSRLGWQASEPQRPSCLCFSITEITGEHYHAHRSSGDPAQVFVLAWQVLFWLNHFPRPNFDLNSLCLKYESFVLFCFLGGSLAAIICNKVMWCSNSGEKTHQKALIWDGV